MGVAKGALKSSETPPLNLAFSGHRRVISAVLLFTFHENAVAP